MLASTGKRPTAIYPVAAIGDRRGALRRERACADHVRPWCIDCVERRSWQEREELRRLTTDHNGPAGGAISRRQLGQNLNARGEIDLKSAMAARDEHAEEP